MEEILASIRRIIADDDDKPNLEAGAPEPVDEPEEGVLDLASVAEERAGSNLEIDLPDISFQVAPEPEAAVAEPPEPPAPPPPAPEPAREPPPVEPAPSRLSAQAEQLISHEATASVSHAFGLLSHTIMSQNAHTLEDIVREMLRPMLKTWLDDNLPPLVERLVAAEIQRVARGQR